MIRRLALAFVACALVVGCKGKQTKTDEVQTTPLTGEQGVDSTPMNFDATGSDSGRIEGLTTIHFDYDKSSLSSEARSKLQGNVDWMKKNAGVRIQIEGHCDARGSIEYNLALGERRANSVKSYIVSQGIAANRLSTISYGKEKPLLQGDTEEAFSKNRRANFVPLQ